MPHQYGYTRKRHTHGMKGGPTSQWQDSEETCQWGAGAVEEWWGEEGGWGEGARRWGRRRRRRRRRRKSMDFSTGSSNSNVPPDLQVRTVYIRGNTQPPPLQHNNCQIPLHMCVCILVSLHLWGQVLDRWYCGDILASCGRRLLWVGDYFDFSRYSLCLGLELD